MIPDWASVEAALTVKVPLAEGRKKRVPDPLSQVLPAERPLKVTVGVVGAVVSTRIGLEATELALPTW